MIPVESFPLAVPFFVLDSPTFITGDTPPANTLGRMMLWFPKPLTNATGLEFPIDLNAHDIARLIAKVGLGYAIAAHGRDAFDQIFVRDLILGRSPCGNEFVGTIDFPKRFDSNRLHAHEVVVIGGVVTTRVQFFRPPHAHQPTPVYEVVVGRLR